MNIIVKHYEHFNRAFNKYIGSKKQYDEEMAKGGYIPFEKAEQMAEQTRNRMKKTYNGLSEKTMRFLHQVKSTADRKGNIEVSDRFVKGLKENGVRIDCKFDSLPKHYQGGFDAT